MSTPKAPSLRVSSRYKRTQLFAGKAGTDAFKRFVEQGGLILGKQGIHDAYTTGRGSMS